MAFLDLTCGASFVDNLGCLDRDCMIHDRVMVHEVPYPDRGLMLHDHILMRKPDEPCQSLMCRPYYSDRLFNNVKLLCFRKKKSAHFVPILLFEYKNEKNFSDYYV
ncbi:unnamed protein product [Lupinus luteus]|uniref:Uncharacterized protein n=1 Tax=Lupinus luteus TaxID=3873 RepID=A0AAV1WKA1_LUPLU